MLLGVAQQLLGEGDELIELPMLACGWVKVLAQLDGPGLGVESKVHVACHVGGREQDFRLRAVLQESEEVRNGSVRGSERQRAGAMALLAVELALHLGRRERRNPARRRS